MDRDFLRYWLGKLEKASVEHLGSDAATDIMAGREIVESGTDEQVLEWLSGVVARVEGHGSDDQVHDVMTDCSCPYSKEDIAELHELYEDSGDLDLVHKRLQEKFLDFCKDVKGYGPDVVDRILDERWGVAGIKRGNIITAIKKPARMDEFLQNEGRVEGGRAYCHCPTVRQLVGTEHAMPESYCLCGAGFYRYLWEGITGRKVQVKVERSVLHGGNGCAISIDIGSVTE